MCGKFAAYVLAASLRQTNPCSRNVYQKFASNAARGTLFSITGVLAMYASSVSVLANCFTYCIMPNYNRSCWFSVPEICPKHNIILIWILTKAEFNNMLVLRISHQSSRLKNVKISHFSSPELEVQVSFSDHLSSVCKLSFSSSSPEPLDQFQPNLAQSIPGWRE